MVARRGRRRGHSARCDGGVENLTEITQLVVPGGRKLAEEWALLLASQAIECRVTTAPEGLVIQFAADERDRALSAIAIYQEENPAAESQPPATEEELGEPGFSGILVALGLFLVYSQFGGSDSGHPIFQQGHASSTQILAGQWWRTLTALFLHADLGHLVGNALFGVYFITAVTRSFGDGFGLLLVLLSGALGNALNAWGHGPVHHSIGASTAVFGAIGLLVGSALARRGRAGVRGQRLLVPLGAGLGLLAMLGVSGARVDVWAHAYGLLAGAVLGLSMTLLRPERPGRLMQWVYGGLALGAAALAWKLAVAG